MDYTFTSQSDSPAGASSSEPGSADDASGDGGFRISSRPSIPEAGESTSRADELPRSYGGETLCLMPRDPHSLFAYWDIDWAKAFGEAAPRERKVHLRILAADGSEGKKVEVEPMAGGRIVEIAAEDAGYTAEIGYYDSAGGWQSVAASAPVNTPPALPTDGVAADVTTIPFHLSFQRMLDVLRVSRQDSESLTEMLTSLRERADSDEPGNFTVHQRELVETIDQFIAHGPSPAADDATATVVWTQEQRERLLGFRSSSLPGGYGGSSKL